jgi:hypothetical protein
VLTWISLAGGYSDHYRELQPNFTSLIATQQRGAKAEIHHRSRAAPKKSSRFRLLMTEARTELHLLSARVGITTHLASHDN